MPRKTKRPKKSKKKTRGRSYTDPDLNRPMYFNAEDDPYLIPLQQGPPPTSPVGPPTPTFEMPRREGPEWRGGGLFPIPQSGGPSAIPLQQGPPPTSPVGPQQLPPPRLTPPAPAPVGPQLPPNLFANLMPYPPSSAPPPQLPPNLFANLMPYPPSSAPPPQSAQQLSFPPQSAQQLFSGPQIPGQVTMVPGPYSGPEPGSREFLSTPGAYQPAPFSPLGGGTSGFDQPQGPPLPPELEAGPGFPYPIGPLPHPTYQGTDISSNQLGPVGRVTPPSWRESTEAELDRRFAGQEQMEIAREEYERTGPEPGYAQASWTNQETGEKEFGPPRFVGQGSENVNPYAHQLFRQNDITSPYGPGRENAAAWQEKQRELGRQANTPLPETWYGAGFAGTRLPAAWSALQRGEGGKLTKDRVRRTPTKEERVARETAGGEARGMEALAAMLGPLLEQLGNKGGGWGGGPGGGLGEAPNNNNNSDDTLNDALGPQASIGRPRTQEDAANRGWRAFQGPQSQLASIGKPRTREGAANRGWRASKRPRSHAGWVG